CVSRLTQNRFPGADLFRIQSRKIKRPHGSIFESGARSHRDFGTLRHEGMAGTDKYVRLMVSGNLEGKSPSCRKLKDSRAATRAYQSQDYSWSGGFHFSHGLIETSGEIG